MAQKITHAIAFFIIYFALNAHLIAQAKFEAHAETPHVEQVIKNFMEHPLFIKKIEAIAQKAVQPSTLSVGLERVTTLFTSLSGLSHVALGFGTCGLLWYSYKKFVTDPQMERCEKKINESNEKIEQLRSLIENKYSIVERVINELQATVKANHSDLLSNAKKYAEENKALHEKTHSELQEITNFIKPFKQPATSKKFIKTHLEDSQRVGTGSWPTRLTLRKITPLQIFVDNYKNSHKN